MSVSPSESSVSNVSDDILPSGSVVSSISQRLSRQTEGAASITLLRIVHACFPSVALDSAFDRLLAGPSGGLAFSNRSFTESGLYASAFKSAKAAFVGSTLEKLTSAPPTLSHPLITAAADDAKGRSKLYLNKDYRQVEMDSLLKVPAPADPAWDLNRDASSRAPRRPRHRHGLLLSEGCVGSNKLFVLLLLASLTLAYLTRDVVVIEVSRGRRRCF